MFKSLLTLVRGTANSAFEATIDQNAILILDQQIRDCGASIRKARKALAVAIAQDRQLQSRVEILNAQIGDLEERAIQALKAGRDKLTAEAAEAIASLENERDAASKALLNCTKETDRFHSIVRSSEQRLRDLERGRRTAKTNDAVLKLRDKGLMTEQNYLNTLSEAEATLARLQSRQCELNYATEVLEELEAETNPKTITEKMADAGFGPPTQKRANDVLKRLKSKSEADGVPAQKHNPSKPNTV